MIQVVFMIRLARQDNFQIGIRVIGRQPAYFGRGLAGSLENDHRFVARAAGKNVEQLVLLFIDQIILVRSQHVAEKLIAALGDGIFGHIEDGLVVSGPGKVIDPFNPFGKELTGFQVLDLEGVLAIARVVRGKGQQVAVVAGSKGANAHELLSFCQFILVQDDLFLSAKAAFFAAENRVLLPFFGARVIEVSILPVRHVLVRLLDVAEHLLIELCLQLLSRLHQRLSVSVFGFEMLQHLRICFFTQPEIIVNERFAMNPGYLGFLFRHGWLWCCRPAVGLRAKTSIKG